MTEGMRLAFTLLVVLIAACGSSAPCDGVACSAGRVCQPATGVCEAVDAGP
jgi:hypothetical protein